MYMNACIVCTYVSVCMSPFRNQVILDTLLSLYYLLCRDKISQ